MQYSERKKRGKMLIFTGMLLFSIPFTPAQALDQNAFIDSLKASVKPYQLEIPSAAVHQTDNNFVIEQATIKDTDNHFFDRLKLSNININGVSETDTGYNINSFKIKTVSAALKKADIVLSGLEADSFIIPKNGNAKPLDSLPAKKLSIANIVAKIQNKDFLTASNVEVISLLENNGIIHNIRVNCPDFTIAVGSIARPNDIEMLKALNLETLHGNTNYHFTIDKERNVFSMDESRFTIDQLGSISITYHIKLEQDDLSKAQHLSNSAGAKTTQGDALKGFDFANNYLQDYKLRYEDQSFTNTALNYFVAETGLPKETLSALVRSVIASSVQENGNFAKEVDSALGTFLAKPQSLTIKLNPEQPVSLETIEELSENDPFAIISRLNVHVLAND